MDNLKHSVHVMLDMGGFHFVNEHVDVVAILQHIVGCVLDINMRKLLMFSVRCVLEEGVAFVLIQTSTVAALEKDAIDVGAGSLGGPHC